MIMHKLNTAYYKNQKGGKEELKKRTGKKEEKKNRLKRLGFRMKECMDNRKYRREHPFLIDILCSSSVNDGKRKGKKKKRACIAINTGILVKCETNQK